MSALSELLLAGRRVESHRPWPRAVVGADTWRLAARCMAETRLTLLDLWGERDRVHMALLDEQEAGVGIISHDCEGRRYPSVGRLHAPALRLERAAADLFGLIPEQSPDTRPWLDHGRWETEGPSPVHGRARDQAYRFLPAEGEGLHQIAVGPVHAGIIEPGHFRFTASGETVVRLEERLGYTHKGIEALMAGSDIGRAARLAGRVSGDSTVAYAIAFACAVESALAVEVMPRALWLRALMAELERLANHLGDIGAICNDAAFTLMHAHCGVLRELVLRASHAAFGHRMMRDCIVPGGVATDLSDAGATALGVLVDEIRQKFPALIKLYEDTASLQDRTVGTGRLTVELARLYGAGGFVGRASGRTFDVRRVLPYAPYDALDFEVPVLEEGDVDARVWIRIREVEQSLSLVDQLLSRLPAGPVMVEIRARAEPSEGMSLVEGFRGDVHAWLRVGPDMTIERCRLRDPSWFQFPLLEGVIEGNIVADFPICNKSFNCSYSGHDL